MRYYLGMIECKTYHADRLEQLWIRRELGDELYEAIQKDYCNLVLLRSNPKGLPSDMYKRIDIYVDIEDAARQTWFILKFPQAQPIRKI